MVTLYAITNDPLYGIVPNWILDNTRTEIRVPERVCATCTGGWATNPSKQPTKLVKIGSNPEEGVIVLHPDYYKPRTATGEALRAHELYHVWQRSVYPNFKELFAFAADETEKAGLEPWENPYEKPAYEFEQSVKEHLLAKGYRE
jgi:hypothetical protein